MNGHMIPQPIVEGIARAAQPSEWAAAFAPVTALDRMSDLLLIAVIEGRVLDRDWARRTAMQLVKVWQREQGR